MFKLVFVLPLLLGAYVGVAVGVTGGVAHAAGVCNVPSLAYPTIQSAVNDPTCNPIDVAAGTYLEQVQISRTLTLNGAQAGNDARTRSGAESVIDHPNGPIQIYADGVTINGFTIQGATANPITDPGAYGAGIWMNPGGYGLQGGAQILNNIIQNNIVGIYLNNTGAIATKVQSNLIRNNNNPGPSSGDGIYSDVGLSNALIDSNTFSGHTSASVVVLGGTNTVADNITVSNNQLVGGTSEGVAFLDVTNSSITGNTSIGSTSSATIDLFGGDTNVAVNGNILANGMRGIQVENPYLVYGVPPNSGVTAHTNCISGNTTAGLEADTGAHTGTLHAENNWWGSSSGPTIASNPGGTGDKIIDPDGVVSYKPWTTAQPNSPCPVSFTKLASGSFVIGDRNAAIGSAVTFWGAQWSKSNALSGGSAPASFKGFADNTTTNPPSCLQNWSTAPGNSSKPPASVPQYMAVIVSSSIGQSGSSISGNTVHVVVVKTNPGYASNPGHAGTGTVVAQLC